MDENFKLNIKELKIALENSLNSNAEIRTKAESYLFSLKIYPNIYSLKLLEILINRNNDNYNEILFQNCCIQLKNIICENIIGNLKDETISIIQHNIFNLLTNAKDKVEMKNYQIIIYKILKCGKKWELFIENVIKYITNKTNFYYSYCGIEIFYLFSKANESIIGREKYDSEYSKIHNIILNNFEILAKNYFQNKEDELYNKYIKKIFKIFIKSITFSPPLEFLKDSKKIIYYSLNFPKNNNKVNLIISKFLLRIYERFFNFNYCDQDDKSYQFFSQFKNDNQIYQDFFNYFSYLSINGVNELNHTLCFIYEFYYLSLTRKNIVSNYILNNYENIIIFSIRNNLLRKRVLKITDKDFLYEITDLPDDNPRKYIFNFILKLVNDNNIESTIKIIINQITNISISNININLFKESGISILYKILKKSKSKKKNEYILEILGNIIIPQLNLVNNLLICQRILLFQAFNFINLIDKIPNLKNEQIEFLINKINEGLIYKNSIALNVICAVILPTIIQYSEKTIDYFKNKLQYIFSLYLNIIKEIDIEELLWSINSIVSIYSNESISYIQNLSFELNKIFFQYISQLKDSEKESKTNLDESSCGIIDILILFFEICLNHNDINKFNSLLQITDNLILFGISEECSKDSMLIYQNVLNLLNLIVEKGDINNILLWKYYEKILDSIIKIENNEIKQNFAFENLPNIINILYLYIIRGKKIFLEHINKTFITIQNIILLCLNIKDETFCCCCLKLLISIFETYYNDKQQLITNLINPLISFISKELFKTKQITYNQFLIQLLATIISYDTLSTVKYCYENNLLEQILLKWNENIETMRYDFEYKRSIIGIFSLILIDSEYLSNDIKKIFNSLLKNSFELIKKYDIIINNKGKNNKNIEEEAECVDNDISLEKNEEEEEEDYEWLDDDLENYSEESDEDYIIEDKKCHEKTYLEKENLYCILFSILNNLKLNFSQNHQNFIYSIIGQENLIYLNNKFNLLNK